MLLTLVILPQELAVCRLPAHTPLPDWLHPSELVSIIWTADETSLVCSTKDVPPGIPVEGPWRAFRVEGTLDFSLTGILLAIAQPLAEAGIAIFAVSTYDTDYILVKQESLEKAVAALTDKGHQIKVKPNP